MPAGAIAESQSEDQAQAPSSAAEAVAMHPDPVLSLDPPRPTQLEPTPDLAGPVASRQATAGLAGSRGPHAIDTSTGTTHQHLSLSKKATKGAMASTKAVSGRKPPTSPCRVNVRRGVHSHGTPAAASPRMSGASAQRSGNSLGHSGGGGSPDAAGSSSQKTRRWKALMVPVSTSEHLDQRLKDVMRWDTNHTYCPPSTADTAATPSAVSAATSAAAAANPTAVVLQAMLTGDTTHAVSDPPATAVAHAAQVPSSPIPHQATAPAAAEGDPTGSAPQKFPTEAQSTAEAHHKRKLEGAHPSAANITSPAAVPRIGAAGTASAAGIAPAAAGASPVLSDTDEGGGKRPRLSDSPQHRTAITRTPTTDAAASSNEPTLVHKQDAAVGSAIPLPVNAQLPARSDVDTIAADSLPDALVPQEHGASVPATAAAGMQPEAAQQQPDAVETKAETTMRVITMHGEQIEARVLEEAASDEDIEID